jgi:hypothetical protein
MIWNKKSSTEKMAIKMAKEAKRAAKKQLKIMRKKGIPLSPETIQPYLK